MVLVTPPRPAYVDVDQTTIANNVAVFVRFFAYAVSAFSAASDSLLSYQVQV